MTKKAYQVFFSAVPVVVMVAFLTAIFFANANLSLAASGREKSLAGARPSAVDHAETQIKKLQGALHITPAQDNLWINLTQVMRENAKDMDALHKDRDENAKTMNALEYMKFHNRITEARLDQMRKLLVPFEAFYNSMSDEQKKTTDIIFRTGRHKKTK